MFGARQRAEILQPKTTGIQILCMFAWVLSGGNDDYGTRLRDSFWMLGYASWRTWGGAMVTSLE